MNPTYGAKTEKVFKQTNSVIEATPPTPTSTNSRLQAGISNI